MLVGAALTARAFPECFCIIERPTGLPLGEAKNLAAVSDARWWIVNKWWLVFRARDERVSQGFWQIYASNPLLLIKRNIIMVFNRWVAVEIVEKFPSANTTIFFVFDQFFRPENNV
jgi:hypothetical protein